MGSEAISKHKSKTVICHGHGSVAPDLVFNWLKMAGLFSLATMLLASPPTFAQAGATLGNIEQKLFFKMYSDESDDARLARVEKQLFGQQMEGAFQERLNRVQGAASPQTNPDGSVTGLGSQQSSGTTSSTKAPTEAELRARADDERQAAIERAKVAVDAARDEQTGKLLETGVSLWRAKRGTEALGYFEQALKADPHNASAHYYAGIVYESKKSYVEALSAYRKAANEDPANQEYSDAVLAVQKLMSSRPAVDPRQAEISKLATEAGEAYKRGEFLSALDLYKQLDQKAPNQALVKYNLGTLYLHAGQFATALDYYQAAVQLRPSDQKFVQAYQKLKANVDKADAVVQSQEAAFNNNNGAVNGGMNGMPGAQGNGMGQGQQQQRPYGHEALNMGAAQARNNQNGGMQNGGGQQSRGGGNDPFTPNVASASTNNQMPSNQSPVNVATPPGTGHAPGYAPPVDGNAALQRWAHTQNKNKGKGGGTTPPAKTQQQQPQQSQSQQSQSQPQQSSQQSFQQSPQQSSQPDFGSNQSQFPNQNSSQNQNSNQFAGQAQPAQTPSYQAPATEGHPLVRHPLKGSKPVASAPPTSHQSTFPSGGQDLGRLQQPAGNPLTDLGILAANGRNGVTISHVGIASRASRAGLLQGDVIRAVDNKVVSSLAQVTDLISKKGSGSTIELHIQRKDQLGTVHL